MLISSMMINSHHPRTTINFINFLKNINNMVFKMQFQPNQYFGKPIIEDYGESMTIQQDVPTLKEILARYATTGEIIGTQKQSFFDDNSYLDCNCIVPDVEDLNIAYQNSLQPNFDKEFNLNSLEKAGAQVPDKERVEKPTQNEPSVQ